MSPKRKSRWEQQRSDWYRDAARTEIKQNTLWLSILLGLGSLALLALGISEIGNFRGWLGLLAGSCCGASLWGLHAGKNWARWVGGLVSAALFFVQLVALFLNVMRLESQRVPDLLMGVVVALMWAAIAYHLLGPGSRTLFEQARVGMPDSDEA